MKLRTLVPLVALMVVATPLLAGPPWIAVELPANPFDRVTRDAFLVVHTFHHTTENGAEPVTGRAIGIVDGQRRTVTLGFDRTSRPGVYAVRNTWGEKGDWTLILTNDQGTHGGAAEIMVKVSGNKVVGIDAATKKSAYAELRLEPRRFTDAEIEASLKGRAAGG